MRHVPLLFCALWIALLGGLTACDQKRPPAAGGEDFLRLSNVGKAHLERGDSAQALVAFEKALALQPNHPDAKLNLARAHLLAGNDAPARALASAVLELDRGSAPALYIAGVAALHQRDFTNAIQFLQEAKDIDIRENAVSLQLGLAYEGLGQWQDALAQYEEIAQFEPDFPGVHFRLATVYRRLGREEEAQARTQAHSAWLAKTPNANLTPAGLERSKYTQATVPFQLEQPESEGVKVTFTDVSAEALAGAAQSIQGPVGTIDFARNGTNHLLVRDGEAFRVLLNRGGRFVTNEQAFAFTNGGEFTRWLVADLSFDGVPDALVLGSNGARLFRFTTNGIATETTRFAGLNNFAAVNGLLVDLNFRGDLDLVAITPAGELRVMSNLKNMYFINTSTNLPAFTGVRHLASDDWNNDETQDLFVSHAGGLSLLLKQRGGAWSNANVAGQSFANVPAGVEIAVGDLNNDLRPDLATLRGNQLVIYFNGVTNGAVVSLREFQASALKLVDYDNDGWLDVLAYGSGVRLIRNLGAKGFRDVSRETGLAAISGRVDSVALADFDNDCDSDMALGVAGGVRLWRNDGANSNHQLRLTLQGTRSNPSGIGVRVDVVAGGLRVARRARELPLEIGVGKHRMLDAVNVHWSELSPSYTEIDLTNCAPLPALELALPTGSCPYLYTWDGEQTRFVSDLLCSAPLGLPVAPGIYIEADEDELAWVGDETNFKPKPAKNGGSNFVLHITEELREVLYLDEAKLLVVDHPSGTEVHTTEKMLARRPAGGFPRDEFVTLNNRVPLRHAVNDAGGDVTAALRDIDEVFASPTKLREPQLRGLAEPHHVTMEFAAIDPKKPLVLALTGWLRFGGGMANIAASHYREFPFPFPTLEVEVNGQWRAVEVEVGAPSGRAKTILVDLAGKLPSGATRLRVTAAFEIHWDRMALFERSGEANTRVIRLSPSHTDLHRRGYSEMRTLAGTEQLVPVYTNVSANPLWRLTPSGWATRYGEVGELVAARDNALALICAGDELTLEFAAQHVPEKSPGNQRSFFVLISGWDKDSDFHVASGTTLEPLPWHGLNEQTYATDRRPAFTNDAWIQKYNTRWVGPRILSHR